MLLPPHDGCSGEGAEIVEIEGSPVVPDGYEGEQPVLSIPAMANGTMIESIATLNSWVSSVPENLKVGDWYTDEACTTPVVIPFAITPETKLYPKFEYVTPMVSYVARLIHEEGAEVPEVLGLPETKEASVVETPELTAKPTADGFTFIGWYTDPDGITKPITDAEIDKEKGNTFYALFLQSEVKVDDGIHEPVTYYAASRTTAESEPLSVSAGGFYEVRNTSTANTITKDLYIPSTIIGVPVEIGERAFWSEDIGDNINVDITVRNIGDNAFESIGFGKSASSSDGLSYSFKAIGTEDLDGRIGESAFASADLGNIALTVVDVVIENTGVVAGSALNSLSILESTSFPGSATLKLGHVSASAMDSMNFFEGGNFREEVDATVSITIDYAEDLISSSSNFFTDFEGHAIMEVNITDTAELFMGIFSYFEVGDSRDCTVDFYLNTNASGIDLTDSSVFEFGSGVTCYYNGEEISI